MRLIFGDGKLGTELATQTNWKIVSRKQDGIDITKPHTYEHVLMYNDNLEIVNCMGHVKTLDNTKDLHWKINYVAVIDLVNMCNLYNVKLIHISSDFIYGLSKEFATEEDIPVHYPQWYIYTKLLADGYIQAKANNYLLIRASFKENPFPYSEAFEDLNGNFDYINVIANKIIKLIELNEKGVFNVGTEFKNMYELAKQTKSGVTPVLKKDHYTYDINVTMDTKKYENCTNKLSSTFPTKGTIFKNT